MKLPARWAGHLPPRRDASAGRREFARGNRLVTCKGRSFLGTDDARLERYPPNMGEAAERDGGAEGRERGSRRRERLDRHDLRAQADDMNPGAAAAS